MNDYFNKYSNSEFLELLKTKKNFSEIKHKEIINHTS